MSKVDRFYQRAKCAILTKKPWNYITISII
jgi:hypothetical protein